MFLTFLLINVLVGLLGKVLGTIFSFPILSMMNRMGGAVLGGAKGICMVWIFFLIIAVFWDNAWAQNCYYLIREIPLSVIYMMKYISIFLKGIMK